MTAQAGPGVGSRYVDYDQVADRYATGRSLPEDVLDRWGDAVRPHVRAAVGRRPRVADIGAGTGIFTRAWRQWMDAEVVAVEPAEAMIRTAGHDSAFLRGVAESLPLKDASVDAIWLSTTLHHFADPAAAALEFGRVVAPEGRFLIRTHVPERTSVGWLRVFPGHERALSRFHRLDELADLFSPAGLRIRHISEVRESRHTFAKSADWAERMRRADSVLTALTDDEMSEGLAALRADPSRTVDLELSLVVLASVAGSPEASP